MCSPETSDGFFYYYYIYTKEVCPSRARAAADGAAWVAEGVGVLCGKRGGPGESSGRSSGVERAARSDGSFVSLEWSCCCFLSCALALFLSLSLSLFPSRPPSISLCLCLRLRPSLCPSLPFSLSHDLCLCLFISLFHRACLTPSPSPSLSRSLSSSPFPDPPFSPSLPPSLCPFPPFAALLLGCGFARPISSLSQSLRARPVPSFTPLCCSPHCTSNQPSSLNELQPAGGASR